MENPCWKTIIALALAGVTVASSLQPIPPNITTQPFEVDVVFPRNDKYMRMQNWTFPFVLAVQNFPTSTVGNLSWVWRWNIEMWMLQSDGTVNWNDGGGIDFAIGRFETLQGASAADPTFLIAVSNYTTWHTDGKPGKLYDARYLLRWTGSWSYADSACNSTGRVENKGVFMFNVVSRKGWRRSFGSGLHRRGGCRHSAGHRMPAI